MLSLKKISSASYVISEEESPEESPRHSLGMVVGESSFAMNGGGGDVDKYQLTHNREYWFAVSSSVCLSRIIFISLDFWTLIIYKFLKLITSVRVTIQLNLEERPLDSF